MTSTSYKAAQDAFVAMTGLKYGDKVTILRSAKDREFGWPNSWNKYKMDPQVGKTLTVKSVSDSSGIYCTDGYYYPFFCLQVTPVENVKITLQNGYDAIIHAGSGEVHVGCQKLPFELVKQVYDAAVAARKGTAPAKKVAKKTVRAKKSR